MNAIQIKNTVLAILAAVGSVIAQALGGWDTALMVLVCFMAADYGTGLLVAAVWHRSGKSDSGKLESGACFKGLIRKCMILLMVWVGAMLDAVTGYYFVRTAVCLFFIANEGLSILENTAVMGVPYPKFVHEILEVMREQADAGTAEDKENRHDV